MLAGETAESIARALGGGVSGRTISRRMVEMRYGAGAAPPEAPEAECLPVDPEAVPEDTSLATVDRWIARIEELARVAELHQDTARIGNLGRLMATLLEVKRKGTPPPRSDPNESPDMLAAKERARKAFYKLLDAAREGP